MSSVRSWVALFLMPWFFHCLCFYQSIKELFTDRDPPMLSPTKRFLIDSIQFKWT
ncbi:hypothetical protein BDE02_09G128300 [Populus trichocarpa]|nr:hypothetical protein BDE02_09G128300 [Populus trichocarpa]